MRYTSLQLRPPQGRIPSPGSPIKYTRRWCWTLSQSPRPRAPSRSSTPQCVPRPAEPGLPFQTRPTPTASLHPAETEGLAQWGIQLPRLLCCQGYCYSVWGMTVSQPPPKDRQPLLSHRSYAPRTSYLSCEGDISEEWQAPRFLRVEEAKAVAPSPPFFSLYLFLSTPKLPGPHSFRSL